MKPAPVYYTLKTDTVEKYLKKYLTPELLEVLGIIQAAIAEITPEKNQFYGSGGFVRDLVLLNLKFIQKKTITKDVDLIFTLNPQLFSQLLENETLKNKLKKLGVALSRPFPETPMLTLTINNERYEITSIYKINKSLSQMAQENVFTRDLTCNGLLLPFNKNILDLSEVSIVDYVGGIRHIEEKKLALIGEPKNFFFTSQGMIGDSYKLSRALRIISLMAKLLDEGLVFKLDSQLTFEMQLLGARKRLSEYNDQGTFYKKLFEIFISNHADTALYFLERYEFLPHLFPDYDIHKQDIFRALKIWILYTKNTSLFHSVTIEQFYYVLLYPYVKSLRNNQDEKKYQSIFERFTKISIHFKTQNRLTATWESIPSENELSFFDYCLLSVATLPTVVDCNNQKIDQMIIEDRKIFSEKLMDPPKKTANINNNDDEEEEDNTENNNSLSLPSSTEHQNAEPEIFEEGKVVVAPNKRKNKFYKEADLLKAPAISKNDKPKNSKNLEGKENSTQDQSKKPNNDNNGKKHSHPARNPNSVSPDTKNQEDRDEINRIEKQKRIGKTVKNLIDARNYFHASIPSQSPLIKNTYSLKELKKKHPDLRYLLEESLFSSHLPISQATFLHRPSKYLTETAILLAIFLLNNYAPVANSNIWGIEILSNGSEYSQNAINWHINNARTYKDNLISAISNIEIIVNNFLKKHNPAEAEFLKHSLAELSDTLKNHQGTIFNFSSQIIQSLKASVIHTLYNSLLPTFHFFLLDSTCPPNIFLLSLIGVALTHMVFYSVITWEDNLNAAMKDIHNTLATQIQHVNMLAEKIKQLYPDEIEQQSRTTSLK